MGKRKNQDRQAVDAVIAHSGLLAIARSMGDTWYTVTMPEIVKNRKRYQDNIDIAALIYAWDSSTQTMDWDAYRTFWHRHWGEEMDPHGDVPRCHEGCPCGSPGAMQEEADAP